MDCFRCTKLKYLCYVEPNSSIQETPIIANSTTTMETEPAKPMIDINGSSKELNDTIDVSPSSPPSSSRANLKRKQYRDPVKVISINT